MSVGYVLVQWNRHKKIYDVCVVSLVALYLSAFLVVGKLLFRGVEAISDEILLIRALGSCAFVMLTLVLSIGPLTRLDSRFFPLLYNRRHLGVATFLVASMHALLATGFYHGFGTVNPLVSLLFGNTSFGSLRAFPFQILGLGALAILFLMAATSHDFWNNNLGPRTWKALHMLAYPAYTLVVFHVALGAMQTQRSVLLGLLVIAAAAAVVGLHLFTGRRETRRDIRDGPGPALDGWLDVGAVDEIPHDRAIVVCVPGGERVAVFRYDNRVSAVTNVCRHQSGPLGEGKIIDGCITCPWHGWQYRPADGCSPPPFTERIATYRVRIREGRVQFHPEALAPGTPVQPAQTDGAAL